MSSAMPSRFPEHSTEGIGVVRNNYSYTTLCGDCVYGVSSVYGDSSGATNYRANEWVLLVMWKYNNKFGEETRENDGPLL